MVTVRTALEHSLNVPTIKVAERIGYDRVAAMAKRLGLNAKIKGYPSVALGAFEVTPIEMAGAYTAFANEGRRMQPHALVRVTSTDRSMNKAYKYEPQEVMRPELAYLMTYLMEGVISSGTAAGPTGVRARGFTLPAAEKPERPAMVGSPVIPRISWSSPGWDTTTIATSIWKAPGPHCRSGPSS